jgi:proteasome alpha subunit
MLTPYDWQEGIGHRAQYVEAKLAQGTPVLAISIPEGILLYAYRRQAPKIYEIYDNLAFSAVGQQSDVEALRVAALDFAHQEGFRRSERDVTLQRVIVALSNPIKQSFANFSSSPVVARSLFAEVGPNPADDTYAILDFDGDYTTLKNFAAIAGSDSLMESMRTSLEALNREGLDVDHAIAELQRIWSSCQEEVDMQGLQEEVMLIERAERRVNRFRSIH